MPSYVGKLAPITIVLGVVVYCSISGLSAGGTKNQAKPSGKPLEISTALLTPKLPPPAKRSPFQITNAEQQPTDSTADVGADGGAEPGQATAETPPRPPVDLSAVFLSATLIAGEHRSAIINGHVYTIGEQLEMSKSDAPPCVITAIEYDRVLLECQGAPLELRYQDKTAPLSADTTSDVPRANNVVRNNSQ